MAYFFSGQSHTFNEYLLVPATRRANAFQTTFLCARR